MTSLCWQRWLAEPAATLHYLTPDRLGVDAFEFQRSRRIWADEHASEDLYLVVDDDMLAPRDPQFDRVHELFEKYPDFGMLSAMPSNCKIVSPGPNFIDNWDILEHESTGGARFCRRGLVKDWPPMGAQSDRFYGKGRRPAAYDRIHSEALKSAGWRVGYARQIRWTHLGEGFSTVWV